MSKNNKNKITWLLALGLVFSGIFGVYKLANFSPNDGGKTETGDDAASVILAVKENDWYKGGKEAEAVLIEYSDFQCPACRAYNPILQQLNREFGEDLKIIYRHFPLFQIHSPLAGIRQRSGSSGGLSLQ